MRLTQWLTLPAACLFALVIAGPVRAQPPASPEGQQRAGNPLEVAPWARPTATPRHVVYLVGGGSGNYRKGEPPLPDEGTWGWDYRGGLIQRRVILDRKSTRLNSSHT